MGKEVVFALLPYLKTSESLSMRGIRFRSSDDLTDLAPEQQKHLKTLFSMFFLRDDLRITRMASVNVHHSFFREMHWQPRPKRSG